MSSFKSGDWNCQLCNNHNFARREVCKKCNANKNGQKILENTTVNLPIVPIVVKDKDLVPEYYLSIDIERIGPDFKYGILAIGICFGKSDGTIIEQRAFCDKVPTKDRFDQRTWNEFWSKFPEILSRIDKEAISDHIKVFNDYLIELEKKYGPFGRKNKDKVVFKLLSDNPGYDMGMINLEFYKSHFLSKSIAEMFNDYVSTDDPTQIMRGMNKEQRKEVEKYITAPHDHWPVNDATQIYQMRCGIKSVMG